MFQYYCSGDNVERVRGPTVSLGAIGPREFDLLTPAAQHNVLIIPDKVQLLCGVCHGAVCTQMYSLHTYIHVIHTCVEHNIVNAVNEKCDVAS